MFDRGLLCLALILSCAGTAAVAASDEGWLQGSWAVTTPGGAAEQRPLRIEGDRWTAPGGARLRFRADPGKSPPELDLRSDGDGPPGVWHGIYLAEGDTMTFCRPQAAEAPRPRDCEPAKGLVVMRLTRVDTGSPAGQPRTPLAADVPEQRRPWGTLALPAGTAAGALPLVIDLSGMVAWPPPAGRPPYALARLEGTTFDYSTPAALSATIADVEQRVLKALDDLGAGDRVNTRRAILAGFSIGGDVSWAIAQRNPARLMGALTVGSRDTYAFARTGLTPAHRFAILMGTEDAPDRAKSAHAAAAGLAQRKVPVWFCDMPGVGHRPDDAVVGQALARLLDDGAGPAASTCRAGG